MRDQTKRLTQLLKEFEGLKKKLFAQDSFVVLPEGPETDRYNQLLGLFQPKFRTKGWRNPLGGENEEGL